MTTQRSEDAVDGPEGSALARRLNRPARRVALGDLPAGWFHSIILARCRDAADLADQPGFPGKVRGAWGEALKGTASAEALADRPCPWVPPSALDVFFRGQGRVRPELEIPKPYVIAVFPEAHDLWVRLTLFGFATEWTEMAAEALLLALRGRLSIGRRLEVVDRRYWSEEGVALPAAACLALTFETPGQMRQQQQVRPIDFRSLVNSLCDRIQGLARWQDAEVLADWSALKDQARALSVSHLGSTPESWSRHSRRQNKDFAMAGERSQWLISGELAPLLPLLAIGTTTHAGGRASLGLGRYRLQPIT